MLSIRGDKMRYVEGGGEAKKKDASKNLVLAVTECDGASGSDY